MDPAIAIGERTVNLDKGQQHVWKSPKYGDVTIENVGNGQLNVQYFDKKLKEKGYVNFESGNIRNVPEELLIEISKQ